MAALVIATQLFAPPAAGLADNGDFPRIMGLLHIDYVTADRRERYFNYFSPRHRVVWGPKFTSARLSSEVFPATIALAISMEILPRDAFDLRVLGVVHLALRLFDL